MHHHSEDPQTVRVERHHQSPSLSFGRGTTGTGPDDSSPDRPPPPAPLPLPLPLLPRPRPRRPFLGGVLGCGSRRPRVVRRFCLCEARRRERDERDGSSASSRKRAADGSGGGGGVHPTARGGKGKGGGRSRDERAVCRRRARATRNARVATHRTVWDARGAAQVAAMFEKMLAGRGQVALATNQMCYRPESSARVVVGTPLALESSLAKVPSVRRPYDSSALPRRRKELVAARMRGRTLLYLREHLTLICLGLPLRQQV